MRACLTLGLAHLAAASLTPKAAWYAQQFPPPPPPPGWESGVPANETFFNITVRSGVSRRCDECRSACVIERVKADWVAAWVRMCGFAASRANPGPLMSPPPSPAQTGGLALTFRNLTQTVEVVSFAGEIVMD